MMQLKVYKLEFYTRKIMTQVWMHIHSLLCCKREKICLLKEVLQVIIIAVKPRIIVGQR